MVLRNLVKIAIATTEAVGKAFARAIREEVRANQQAASRSAEQATAAGASSSRPNVQDTARLNSKLGITLQESMQILNVKPPLDPKEVEERYKRLFEINEKTKGGSLYLQAKVFRAKERIDAELEQLQQKYEGESQDQTSNTKE